MARTCIFCGGEGLTREHVVPKWVSNLVRPHGPYGGGFTMRTVHVGLREWEQQTHFIELVARCVCEECNTGWMSALESLAAPVLTPLIEGDAVTLQSRDQELVALWAMKTAMVLEETSAASTERYFTSGERRLFADEGVIPEVTQTWIGKKEGTNRLTMAMVKYIRLPDESPSSSPGYAPSIFIGQLCIQLISAAVPIVDSDVEIEYVATDGWQEHTVQIWPIGEDIDWDAMPAMTDEMADALSQRWDKKTS